MKIGFHRPEPTENQLPSPETKMYKSGELFNSKIGGIQYENWKESNRVQPKTNFLHLLFSVLSADKVDNKIRLYPPLSCHLRLYHNSELKPYIYD